MSSSTREILSAATALFLILAMSSCADDDSNEDHDASSDGDSDSDTDSDSDADTDSPDGGPFTAYLADLVVEAPGHTGSGFKDSAHAVDGVHGSAAGGNASDVFSMGYEDGVDNYIILAWSGRKVTNGPGTDFAVFENGFYLGDESSCFMDQVVVYLSNDDATWVPFPHDYTAQDESTYSNAPDDWEGFAGVTPVFYNQDTNPVDPFDPEAAGGDHFDLDLLPSDEGPAQSIKENGFDRIKLVTAPTVMNPDTGELFVRDAMSNGADIDGVMGRYLESK